MLYKVDVSRVFRYVKLDSSEYYLLGICHINWFIDTFLPFEYHHGSALFQCFSDAVHHMMHQCHFHIINYIDDIRIDVPSCIDASFDALHSLLDILGLTVSERKLVHPSTCVNCNRHQNFYSAHTCREVTTDPGSVHCLASQRWLY